MASPAVNIVQALVGQDNTIVIPRVVVKLVGDHMTAAVLCQILYWHGKCGPSFHKTDDELCEEVAVSEYQLRRARKALQDFGITTVRKGIPARLHYQVDIDAFTNKLLSFLGTGGEETKGQVAQETQGLIQKTTQKTTQKTQSIGESPKPRTGEPSESEFFQQCLATYGEVKHVAWADHKGLTDRTKSNLRKVVKYFGGREAALDAFRDALTHLASTKWAQKKLSLDNLTSNDKIISEAEKHRSSNGFTGADARAFQRAQTIFNYRLDG